MEIDKKIEAYINLRSKRSEIKKIYSDADAGLKKKMGVLEMEMLEFLDWNNLKSTKTQYGTLFKQHNLSVTVRNPEKFFDFVIENKAVDLLENRVNKSAYKLYKDDGVDVPGVEVRTEATVKVRKS